MDRVLAVFAYLLLDAILGAIGLRFQPKPGRVPGVLELMAFGMISLPFPFLQFWVLTHHMLWQQYLSIAAIGLAGMVASLVFLRSFGLATEKKRAKMVAVGMIRARDSFVGTGLAGLSALLLFVAAVLIVLVTYLRTDYRSSDFLPTIAVTQFTVRGALILSSYVVVQVALLSGYLDSDVRISTVLSQMFGFIGAVYSICIPIFLFDPSSLRNTIIGLIVGTLPAWQLFGILLLTYLALWLALYVVGTAQNESTLLSFPAWSERWLNGTRAALSDVPDERRADLFAQFRLLLEKLGSFIESDSVADYIAWRDSAFFAALPDALREQNAPEGLIASAETVRLKFADRPDTLHQIFERYRDDIAALDGRYEQADALVTYVRRTLAYIRSEVGANEYDHFLGVSSESSWRQIQLYPEERRMTRRIVTFAGGAGGVFVGVANIFQRLHLKLPLP